MFKLFSRDKPVEVLVVYSSKPIECAYCHTPIKTESIGLRCPICQTIHHPECWKDGGGCAVFGCKKAPKDKR